MKVPAFLAAIVLTLSSQICLAQGLMNSDAELERNRSKSLQTLLTTSFYTEKGMMQAQAIQLVGSPRTVENVEREENVGAVMTVHRNSLVYCYERALSDGDFYAETTMYFTLMKDGRFRDLTADIDAGSADRSKDLLDCVSQRMTSMKAAWGNHDLTFRWKIQFGQWK